MVSELMSVVAVIFNWHNKICCQLGRILLWWMSSYVVVKRNLLGPFLVATATEVHISHIGVGVMPKTSQSGQWHMITGLSYPESDSVNDVINAKLCSLSYVTVNEVADRALQAT